LSGLSAVVFVIVRGFNGYGNAHLLRRDGSWIEWLHASKYPPSLAYAGLELAIAFALLALTWAIGADRAGASRQRGTAAGVLGWPWKPLALFGQTALFYYLLHVHLFKGVAFALGLYRTQGLGVTYLAWLAMLVALYPACRWYLAVKRRHPDGVL